jgi:hypothetical protein
MKNIFLVCLLFTCSLLYSQTMYVAAKSGLSIREKPELGAKVLDKIPYGTKVVPKYIDEGVEAKEVIVEGMNGYWKKVTYNNKTGYIIENYLFPWPPPKLNTAKEIKDYLKQVTTPLGPTLKVNSGSMNNISEGGWALDKQFYKNGAEHHVSSGYEYGGDIYILPGFNMTQGFLLARLIPEFSEVFGEKDEFPIENKKFKRGEREINLKVSKANLGEEYKGYPFIEKISIEYEDGGYYDFEMFMLDNQLVISFSSGV